MPTRFRFRIIPFCAMFIVAAAGIALGQWQTHRAQEKQALQARMQARAAEAPLSALPPDDQSLQDEFRQVSLRGQFIPQWTLYLENRPHQGAVGFHVLTLFKPEGSAQAVVVARGWAPRDAVDRTRVPQSPPPQGTTEVQGLLRRDAGHVLQLGQADAPRPGAILQNLDLAALAQASGMPLSGFVIEQGGDVSDGLLRDWPAPSLGIDRHRGYAVQWYALAAMAVLFFIVTGFRRGRNDKT
ncbi:SURF1 family protein [Herbaspirillum camelliae]|uniref:SURF1 family protein n=1 Tax=Herbaspirillum camelliae TaxID=1892903 RepID=UPI000949C6BF|nr:SURF1 family protein [Herbaspirillum camelliae]